MPRSQNLASSLPNDSTGERKISTDSQFFELDDSDEDRDKAQPMTRRRFSVPEKVLFIKVCKNLQLKTFLRYFFLSSFEFLIIFNPF